MTDWHLMFEAVQKIVQESADFKSGFDKVLRFANDNPEEYDDAEYWQKVATSEMPLSTLKTWAREGFENLPPFDKWSLVLLDCGDAPDIFRMSEIRLCDDSSADEFTIFAQASPTRYAGEFPEAFWDAQQDIKLSDHYVNDLQHPVVRYDVCDNNSYLLWLSVATLALREVLADEAFCKQILRGRSRIVVMSGYEEIFFYIASISEAGFYV